MTKENFGSAQTKASAEDVAAAQTVASAEDVAAAETVASAEDVAAAQTVASAEDVAAAQTVASAEDVAAAQTVASGRPPAAAGDETLPPEGWPDPPRATPAAAAPPRRFGKLEVLEVLGAGGMGEVLAAWDPDLSRKVAVKVLRGGAAGVQGRQRLLREAQAMAQLSHPNVITVHQVGTRGDQVYVVMELVDGGTLRQWTARAPRSWREVVAAYAAAGQGLAAAHAAGLVHRDFKPDNVLVRADGRVLVTDFGLVAAVGEPMEDASPATPTPGSAPAPSREGASSELAARLTRTGDVMGTPYYMAPEQHMGQRADARADQFAFCAALYEALYGVRPFAGASYRELLANVMRGRPRPPPEGSAVPRSVHRLLLRGLAVEAEERFPDMDALLAALRRDPAPARRRWLLAGGLALGLAALAAVGIATLRDDPTARCAAGGRLAAVWSGARRDALHGRLAGSGGAAEPRLVALVDRYAERYARERTAACAATHVTGEQSAGLLDRRLLCLDRRLGQLAALLARLDNDKPAPLLPAALEAIGRLPGFAECRDREQMLAQTPPSATARAAVLRLSADLDRAFAAEQLGDFAGALATAQAARDRARALGYAPLTARAEYLVGRAADRLGRFELAERCYREAAGLAARARTHHLEAEVWLSLIYLVGHATGRAAPALAMAPAAEAAVARAGDDATLRGRLAGNLGLILASSGDYRAARAQLERSLAIFTKAHGADDLDTAVAANNLALLLEKLGEHEAALGRLREVLAVREKRLGPTHPSVATALNDLGNTAHSLERTADARRYLERALEIRRAVLGDAHPRTADTLNNLAIVLGDLGEGARAAALAREAVAVSERAFGAQSPELAGPLNTLGNQLRAQGERKPAWEAFARALAIVEHARGRDHVTVAPLLENLARILSELGLHDRALTFVDRAIAARQRAGGSDHPAAINAVALRGSFHLAADKPAEAVRDFERQRALAKARHGAAHAEVGLAEYNRAVALEQDRKLAQAAAGYRAAEALLARAAPRHQALINAQRGLGDVAAAQGDRRAAAAHYRRAIATARRSGAPTEELSRLLQKVAGQR